MSHLSECTEYMNIVSDIICFDWAKTNCERNVKQNQCDVGQGLIIKGNETKPGEFPHMAAIGWTTRKGVEFKCGGSLISENFVLTAVRKSFDLLNSQS